MNNTHIYILSGLGADHRVFAKLELPINHTFIQWIPEQKKESLQHYASRLVDQIIHEEIILIGLSFGGIMAQEIAALRKVKGIILLSSVKNRSQISLSYKVAAAIKLTYLLPSVLLTNTSILLNYMFSLKSVQEKQLLKQIVSGNKASHFRWALNRIGNWQGINSRASIVQIHGNADKIFKPRLIKNALMISGGGHFMLYTHADKLNPLLEIQLNKMFD